MVRFDENGLSLHPARRRATAAVVTLGEEGALFGINQSRCKVVIADAKLLKVLVKIAGQLKHLKDVITITEPSAKAVESLKKVGMNIQV